MLTGFVLQTLCYLNLWQAPYLLTKEKRKRIFTFGFVFFNYIIIRENNILNSIV